jgi:hypothetical protein
MPRYLLNIMQPDGPPLAPDALASVMRDVGALLDDVRAADALVFNAGLTPPGATTVVRTRGGETLVTDGPYLEAREFIGGFLIVRSPHLDDALGWATRLSRATTLPIAVRPLHGE